MSNENQYPNCVAAGLEPSPIMGPGFIYYVIRADDVEEYISKLQPINNDQEPKDEHDWTHPVKK